jgi:hypothetical protein
VQRAAICFRNLAGMVIREAQRVPDVGNRIADLCLFAGDALTLVQGGQQVHSDPFVAPADVSRWIDDLGNG